MNANIVVGSLFGDEGKGRVVDHYAKKLSDSIVIRYNGGPQAGHTVVNDVTHVHKSYGSGSLSGKETYISEHCCIYPPAILAEYYILSDKIRDVPKLTIHPLAKVITPFDIAFGKVREKILNHGSCGAGIYPTMKRDEESPYKLYAVDLLNETIMKEKLRGISSFYTSKPDSEYHNFLGRKEYDNYLQIELDSFIKSVRSFEFNINNYTYLSRFYYPIFEGAQGIMLDRYFGIFPNVTYSRTTSKNALDICNKLNIKSRDISINYVSRCYMTRHGNGYFPEKDFKIDKNPFETNVENEWQGKFRYSEMDYDLLNHAIRCDISGHKKSYNKGLIVTCNDQMPDFQFDVSKIEGINYSAKSYSPHSSSEIIFNY